MQCMWLCRWVSHILKIEESWLGEISLVSDTMSSLVKRAAKSTHMPSRGDRLNRLFEHVDFDHLLAKMHDDSSSKFYLIKSPPPHLHPPTPTPPHPTPIRLLIMWCCPVVFPVISFSEVPSPQREWQFCRLHYFCHVRLGVNFMSWSNFCVLVWLPLSWRDFIILSYIIRICGHVMDDVITLWWSRESWYDFSPS